MENFLWSIAIFLTIVAGLIGIIVLFRLLSSVVSTVLSVVGFVIGSFFQLIISTVVDIRFLSLVATIFLVMANYERGNWLWLSFILASSLFVISASYIVIFLLNIFDIKLFSNLGSNERDKAFWSSIAHSIFLNIGFLGIFYIVLSFSLVSYSYFLLSTFNHDLPWVFIGPAGVSYHDFVSYTGQTALEAIPLGAARKLGIAISKIDVRADAYTFNAFVMVFQVLLYTAVFSFVGAIRKAARPPVA